MEWERNRLESIRVSKKGEEEDRLFAEYEYDANGNTTWRTIHPMNSKSQVLELEYDTLNRLVQSRLDGAVTTYSYDNAGNRLVKKTPEKTTLYLRHGQIAVAMDIELPEDASVEKGRVNRYVLSGDLLAGRITRVTAVDGVESVEKSYYHLDHLNSTKAVTDDDGVLEVLYEYRAFGEQLKRLDSSGSETDDGAKYSYGGKELDAGSDLYYFNARYYDATIGCFINVDPIQDGSNWYVYVRNNPLGLVDPTGLSPVYAPDISGNPIVDYPGRDLKSEAKIVIERNSDEEYYNDKLSIRIGNQTVYQSPVQSEADIEEPQLTEEYKGRTLETGTYNSTLMPSSYSYKKPIRLVDNYLIHPNRYTTDRKIEARKSQGKSIGPWRRPYSAGCQILENDNFDRMTGELEGLGFKYNNEDMIPVIIRNKPEILKPPKVPNGNKE